MSAIRWFMMFFILIVIRLLVYIAPRNDEGMIFLQFAIQFFRAISDHQKFKRSMRR